MNNLDLNIENELLVLFKNWCGLKPDHIKKLPNSGSNRIYFRLQNSNKSAIGVYNSNRRENIAFIDFTTQFQLNRINVPEIYSQNLDKNIYLISDLGDLQLLEWLKKHNRESDFNEDSVNMYKKVIRELIRIQIVAGRDFSYAFAFDFKEFNKEAILFDLEYFRSKYLDALNISYNHIQLKKDFDLFSEYLSSANQHFFMFRDFQARNIMIVNNEPYFIDYQGGRQGALQYDLVSLLFQAKAQIPNEIKILLRDYYIQTARLFVPINNEEFILYYNAFALIRVLQTLGAYGFRGIIEKKNHFLESIPFAINNLIYLNDKVDILNKLNELKKVIDYIINHEIRTHE